MNDTESGDSETSVLDELAAAANAAPTPAPVAPTPPKLPVLVRLVVVVMQLWMVALFVACGLLIGLTILQFLLGLHPFRLEDEEGGIRVTGWTVPLGLAVAVYLIGKLQQRVIRKLRSRAQVKRSL